MEKFKFSLDRKVVAAFILVVGTYFAFTHDVKTAQATTKRIRLISSIWMLNRNESGYQTKWQGWNGVGTSLVVYMDFSTNTSKGLTTYTDNFNTSSVTTKTESFTTTFTETAVAEVSNTYKVTHTVTNSDGTPGGTATFLGILVNSGNTVLMTQVENGVSKASWSGVCQKV